MPLEAQFTPLPLRTLSAPNLALIKLVTQRPAGTRMGWVATTYPGTAAITSFGGTAETNLRPPASIAFGLAVLVATGSNDSGVTGYNDAAITATAVRLISSFANTHAGNGGNWGGEVVAADAVITPDSATYQW